MGQPWRGTDLSNAINVPKIFADAEETRNGAGGEEF